ncbi:MAG: hypothetical protein WC120_03760 [Parcubacteria group bacterium]
MIKRNEKTRRIREIYGYFLEKLSEFRREQDDLIDGYAKRLEEKKKEEIRKKLI